MNNLESPVKNPAPPPLRVLFLGGSGHIGQRWMALHARQAGPRATEAYSASRQARPKQPRHLVVDVRDARQLRRALQGMDAVVNGAAGSARAIADGTAQVCEAALHLQLRLVHLSTQSVYGPFEGRVHESMPLDDRLGWYGQAKCQAELHVRQLVRQGGQAVVLRPGCVGGAGSWLWVARLAQWLQAGRLGELGAAGDGWTNLVQVDDVCTAIDRALQLPLRAGELPTFNLAAPDSPRWNDYFADLALALDLALQRLPARQLWLDSHLASPPLKAAQWLGRRLGLKVNHWPQPLPPGLPRLWAQQMQLDSQAATERLQLAWTPYAAGLSDAVSWLAQTALTGAASAELLGARERGRGQQTGLPSGSSNVGGRL
jgi:nucleoside-diphosphate-sugar epimerase